MSSLGRTGSAVVVERRSRALMPLQMLQVQVAGSWEPAVHMLHLKVAARDKAAAPLEDWGCTCFDTSPLAAAETYVDWSGSRDSCACLHKLLVALAQLVAAAALAV